MKPIKVNDALLRIVLLIVPCILFMYDFFLSKGATPQANIVYIITVLLVCEGNRFLIYRSREWFSRPLRNLKRLFVLILLGIIFTTLLFVGSKALRNYLVFGDAGMNGNAGFTLHMNDEQVYLGVVGSSIIYAILTFLLLLGIYELAYHFARLRETERERDRLEKEKLHAELQQLKGIVNPHFLFNNLNSLSSLISLNPGLAEDFLDELTKVFRYLLKNNETELTTLGQELQFLDSYYHLLQTRFGDGLSMKVNVNSSHEDFLLPPLTLQLLVENAVKHNRIQKEEPLLIEIFTEPGSKLIIRNNLMIRERKQESTGIGLHSINARYKLLGYEAPAIRKGDGYFIVNIGLIAPTEGATGVGSGVFGDLRVNG